LVTAVGGNVELVEDGVAGRWFAPGEDAALATLMADYLADAQLRGRHAAAARTTALARFSMDAMVAAYRGVYDDMLAPRPSTP
jgi:glycosyltransferase involved in cell wall biosynthesis